jgi:hypothetical protein
MAGKPASSEALMAVGIELLGVGLLALLAGASNDAGNIVVIFMVGLWLIFMITEPSVFTKMSNAVSNVAAASG